ncbi:SWI/SNF-related matrix-associated actin-dependent regulator of chromatin subfamily A containing DEAD/H box 1 [Chaetoceros tenuissimus]|uniref:SWI/SNF-related matrix-associated actin-dependent regulator of chromatin subfamily A containing DEAD/H box 1 n=1 Tax=Chaetoceros tenuissimus TaxID=426638 RepID=A0AAD3CT74_9STRA|nr:SWI/SNF-related matrix-associated actin-dependent regulator of chromatin subfamily A containing DEAD/H box 1 [Chaetoceros tenuissimus]
MSDKFGLAQFAAGKSGGGGWMSTKKRGRDDEQIAKDKKTAMNARKQSSNKRSRSTIAKKATRTKAKVTKTSISKRSSRRKDESDEDSFIASDESEVEYEESEDEDDFLEESDESEEELDLPDDESDDGSIESVEQKIPKKRNVSKSRSRPAPSRAARNLKKKAIDLDSSGDELDESPAIAKAKNIKSRSKGTTSRIEGLDTSEDEEDIQKPISNISRKSKSSNIDLDSSDSDDDFFKDKAMKVKKSSKPTTSKFFQKKSLNDDDDAEMTSPTLNFAKKSKKQKQAFFDSDESDDDTSSKPTVAVAKKQASKQVDDLDDTDDEALQEVLALSKAEALSRLEFEKNNASKVIYKDDIESEEEDEDEGDPEPEDDYVDEKEIEAKNVLDAANKLSAKIVSSMMRWFGDTGDSNNSGLIVDGAIALSYLQNQNENNHAEEKKEDGMAEHKKDEDWITNEDMMRVCPNITLKDYQLVGVNWMALLNRSTFVMESAKDSKKKRKGGNGKNVNGVLADEMGLGKTAQTIAFLAWLKYRHTGIIDSDDDEEEPAMSSGDDDDHKPHIIVVPASVLDNWLREFKKFCPTMNVVKYHGSQAARQKIKNELRGYLPKKKGPMKYGNFQKKKLDVVLTTFSYFSSEKSDDRSFLRKFDWNFMVVDEAHCLKNPKGKAYRNLDAFNTDRRLLLTGTPVQNSPKELMSLLCFLMPLFSREASSFDEDDNNDGGARMLEYFVRLEAVGKKKDAAVLQEEAYKKLKQLLAPFVLRRCKDEVLARAIPPKNRQVEWVPFSDDIREIYDSLLSNHLKKKETSSSAFTHLFTQLRKAANHALLLRTRHTSRADIEHLSSKLYEYGYFGRDATCTQDLVKRELQKFSDYDIHCAAAELIAERSFRSGELNKYLLQEEDLFCSPKFSRLRDLLPKLIKDGHRMLIFSQWTRCLDLLGCLMDAMNLRYLRLDGQTTISERQGLIDQYTNDTDIPVFLLSTRAGGMGINLTAADTCILHDLDFNPFNDIQAEDRVHRIGQQKPVTIIKMVTENTVDADIYQMQERKAQMNAAILQTKSSAAKKKAEMDEMKSMLDKAVERMNDNH